MKHWVSLLSTMVVFTWTPNTSGWWTKAKHCSNMTVCSASALFAQIATNLLLTGNQKQTKKTQPTKNKQTKNPWVTKGVSEVNFVIFLHLRSSVTQWKQSAIRDLRSPNRTHFPLQCFGQKLVLVFPLSFTTKTGMFLIALPSHYKKKMNKI